MNKHIKGGSLLFGLAILFTAGCSREQTDTVGRHIDAVHNAIDVFEETRNRTTKAVERANSRIRKEQQKDDLNFDRAGKSELADVGVLGKT